MLTAALADFFLSRKLRPVVSFTSCFKGIFPTRPASDFKNVDVSKDNYHTEQEGLKRVGVGSQGDSSPIKRMTVGFFGGNVPLNERSTPVSPELKNASVQNQKISFGPTQTSNRCSDHNIRVR